MKKTQSLIFCGTLAAAMLVPMGRRVPNASGALPSSPLPFNTALLLSTRAAAVPPAELSRLEKTVILRYVVGAHEDLWSICRRCHIDAFSIRSSNDLDDRLPPGTVLRIPNHKGTLYEVDSPENLHAISSGFTRGKLLGAAYEREVLEANDYPLPDLSLQDYPFAAGTVLFLPDAWKPTGLPFPFVSDGHRLRITSRFGMRKHPILGNVRHHSGYDIAKPYGTPVMASREGEVVSAGWAGGYGNMIELRHTIKSRAGDRVFYTRYGHLSKILVHEGQRVRMYQLIGRVGSTGLSTGPHLHFEVRNADGEALDPGRFQ